jgi:hypothetical protein
MKMSRQSVKADGQKSGGGRRIGAEEGGKRRRAAGGGDTDDQRFRAACACSRRRNTALPARTLHACRIRAAATCVATLCYTHTAPSPLLPHTAAPSLSCPTMPLLLAMPFLLPHTRTPFNSARALRACGGMLYALSGSRLDRRAYFSITVPLLYA